MVNLSNSAVTLLISGLFSSASFAAEFSLSSPDLQPGQAIKSEQYWNSFGCQGVMLDHNLNGKMRLKSQKLCRDSV